MSKYTFSNKPANNWMIFGFVGLIIAASFFIADRQLSGFILAPISLAIITARYGIELNLSTKTIRYFYSVFGIKSGKKKGFNDLEYLAVKSGTYSQTMGSRGSTHNFSFMLFTLCVFIDGESHELKKSKKEDKINTLKTELSESWNIPVH